MKSRNYPTEISADIRPSRRVSAQLERLRGNNRCIRTTAFVYEWQSGTRTALDKSGRGNRGQILPHRIFNRLNTSLERWLPEQRLFLRSVNSTRFVRLRPLTQLVALGGTAAVFAWSIVASSILVIDSISSGSSREQVLRAQSAFEERLDQLSGERDARAAEAAAAQNRFSVALDQVSQMQSQLLSSEERRRELETGMGAVQTTLRDTIHERDTAATRADTLTAAIEDRTGAPLPQAGRSEEFSVALDILSGELKQTSSQRDDALADAEVARGEAEVLATERDLILALSLIHI